MRRVILVFVIIFVFIVSVTGCNLINKKPKDMTSYLKELNSYSVDMDIQVNNDKQKLDYSGRQIYTIGLGYRLELNNDRIMIYKDDKIYISDLRNNQKYVTDKQFDDTLSLSFLGEFIGLLYTNENIKCTYKIINDVEYEIISTSVSTSNRNISYGELYVKVNEKLPEKLIIYDYKGNEKILVTYKSFVPNVKTDSSLFNIDASSKK